MLVLRWDESVVTLLILRRYGVYKVFDSPSLSQPGLKARVQRTVRVVLARVGERVARTGRERALHTGVLFLNSPIWPRPQAAARISVRVGRSPACTAPFARHMIIRHLIFNSM